jgi:hypothetical protein
MTRYYYRSNECIRYAHRDGRLTIAEIVRALHIVTWDAKAHKHHFACIDYEADTIKNGWAWVIGTPFTFENPEHEREFLDFHPDAADLRRVYSYYHGGCVGVKIEVINYEDLPIFKKGNRWFWKK